MSRLAPLALSLLIAGAASAEEGELPAVTPLDEVELTITSVSLGLLAEDCEYGPHTETILIKGTGEAQHTFQVLGRDCPPETRSFTLDEDLVENMISDLVATHFHRLRSEYDAEYAACIDCAPDVPSGSLVVVQEVTSPAPDITVQLRLGDFDHTVHYRTGADVPGLSDLVRTWRPMLWRKAGFLRHFP